MCPLLFAIACASIQEFPNRSAGLTNWMQMQKQSHVQRMAKMNILRTKLLQGEWQAGSKVSRTPKVQDVPQNLFSLSFHSFFFANALHPCVQPLQNMSRLSICIQRYLCATTLHDFPAACLQQQTSHARKSVQCRHHISGSALWRNWPAQFVIAINFKTFWRAE